MPLKANTSSRAVKIFPPPRLRYLHGIGVCGRGYGVQFCAVFPVQSESFWEQLSVMEKKSIPSNMALPHLSSAIIIAPPMQTSEESYIAGETLYRTPRHHQVGLTTSIFTVSTAPAAPLGRMALPRDGTSFVTAVRWARREGAGVRAARLPCGLASTVVEAVMGVPSWGFMVLDDKATDSVYVRGESIWRARRCEEPSEGPCGRCQGCSDGASGRNAGGGGRSTEVHAQVRILPLTGRATYAARCYSVFSTSVWNAAALAYVADRAGGQSTGCSASALTCAPATLMSLALGQPSNFPILLALL
ncbi:hypothetical protein B0H12DRAFT_1247008 [Mycena haematopus]|nr:hypothetical protein B0H12DRAFT_1247008 [Mycena haematopus]